MINRKHEQFVLNVVFKARMIHVSCYQLDLLGWPLLHQKNVHTRNIGFITHNLSGFCVIVHVHNMEIYANTKLKCYSFFI